MAHSLSPRLMVCYISLFRDFAAEFSEDRVSTIFSRAVKALDGGAHAILTAAESETDRSRNEHPPIDRNQANAAYPTAFQEHLPRAIVPVGYMRWSRCGG